MPHYILDEFKKLHARTLFAGGQKYSFTANTIRRDVAKLFSKDYGPYVIYSAFNALEKRGLIEEIPRNNNSSALKRYTLTTDGRSVLKDLQMCGDDTSNRHHLLTQVSTSPNVVFANFRK